MKQKRQLATVIPEIIALIPNPPPPEVADQMVVLTSNLKFLLKAAQYTAPEATMAEKGEWDDLQSFLYRYMPKPTAYTWAQEISTLVMGPATAGE